MKLAHFSGLAASLGLLSACSYLPWKSEAPLQVHVNVIGARNLGTQDAPSLADMNFPAGDGKPYTINFPITVSFECDTDRTQCKHAVANTELTISSEKQSANSVKLNATLRTKSPAASNVRYTQDTKAKNQVAQITMPESASPEVQQLSAVLQRGGSLDLNGANDVRLRVTVK